MNSYIQFIGSDCSHWGKWYSGMNTGFLSALKERASKTELLRFVLDQTLILSELFWLYGVRGSEFIANYSACIKEFTDTNFKENDFSGVHIDLLRTVRNIQKVWYGGEWIDVDINKVKIFLFDFCDYWKNNTYGKEQFEQLFPMACKPSIVIPYLMHRNRIQQENYHEYVGEVEVPYICQYDGRVVTYRVNVGHGFVARFEERELGEAAKSAFRQISRYSFLTFLAKTMTVPHTDAVSGQCRSYFDSIIRTVAGMTFHGDTTRIVTSNFRLFYATAVVLNGMFSADFINIAKLNCCFPIRTSLSGCNVYGDEANALFNLLIIKNAECGMQMSSLDLFVRFFASFCIEYRNNNKAYLDMAKVVKLVVSRKNDGCCATEGLDALKNITGICSMEAIDLISRRTTVSTQEPGAAETVEKQSVKESEIDFDDFDSIFPDDAGHISAEDGDEKSSKSTDGQSGSEEEDLDLDDPSDGEDGKDGGNADTSGGENAEGNADGTSSGDGDQNPVSTTNSNPESVEASDANGIEIRFVQEGSETVESVMIREELDQFISEILTNPPKKLSPQAVSALTALQNYCIHLLSVETIVGILKCFVALPDKFKTIQNSPGENS